MQTTNRNDRDAAMAVGALALLYLGWNWFVAPYVPTLKKVVSILLIGTLLIFIMVVLVSGIARGIAAIILGSLFMVNATTIGNDYRPSWKWLDATGPFWAVTGAVVLPVFTLNLLVTKSAGDFMFVSTLYLAVLVRIIYGPYAHHVLGPIGRTVGDIMIAAAIYFSVAMMPMTIPLMVFAVYSVVAIYVMIKRLETLEEGKTDPDLEMALGLVFAQLLFTLTGILFLHV